MRLVTIIVSLLATTGCVMTDPPTALPPIASEVNEVRVIAKVGCDQPNSGTGDLCGVIADPARIERVIAFINARPNRWNTPWAGAPIHPVHIQFYRDGEFVESFGIASTSFERQTFLSRPATRSEVDEALALVELNRSYLRHRMEDPVPE
jgi:hypothetical protein